MIQPTRTDYVLTFAIGASVTVSLHRVDDLRWTCALIDSTGTECWHSGPWASRDRALSACCSKAEQRWGRIARCEQKAQLDELTTLREIAQIAREDRALRENTDSSIDALEMIRKLDVLEQRMNASLDALDAANDYEPQW